MICVGVCVFVCLCVFSIRACLVACNYEPVHNEDIYMYVYIYIYIRINVYMLNEDFHLHK